MKLKALLLTGAITLLAACASSPLKQTWSSQDGSKIAFQKTLMLVIAPSESNRRLAEESLVQDMIGFNGQAAYKVLGEDPIKDIAAAKAKVAELGFDGVVVIQYLGMRQEVQSTPSAGPYGGFWGYYGHYGYGYPGYYGNDVTTRNIVSSELSIFSLKEDKLLWSSRADMTNPKDVAAAIYKLATATLEDLQARGRL